MLFLGQKTGIAGKMIVSKDVQALIAGNYGFVTSHSKTDFKDVINSIYFEI